MSELRESDTLEPPSHDYAEPDHFRDGSAGWITAASQEWMWGHLRGNQPVEE